MPTNTPMAGEAKGMLLGLLGVAAFSLTLPATRAAVEALSPFFVGMGRAVVASLLAAIYLAAGRHRLPTKSEFKSLIIVALGVVVGFPILTALAMRYVDASHGGIMLGILPLATAAAGFVFSRERPSVGFWAMALLGSALVVMFSLLKGGGSLHLADLALLAAVASASNRLRCRRPPNAISRWIAGHLLGANNIGSLFNCSGHPIRSEHCSSSIKCVAGFRLCESCQSVSRVSALV